MRRLLLLVLICSWSRATVAGTDPVLARGNGFEIRGTELDAMFAHHKAELLASGRLLRDEQTAAARAQLLDQLVFLRLCRARATQADLLRATLDSQSFVSRLKSEHGTDGFRTLLRRAGYQEADFETNKFAEAVVTAVIDREVKSGIVIPTTDRRKFYDENPDRWMEPASCRIAWLPLSLVDASKGTPLPPDVVQRKRTLALRLRDRARNGEDFAALVRANSEDPKSRDSKGESVIVRGQVANEIEEAAFRLAPGQISDPVEFAGGIGIVKVLERREAKPIPFERVDAEIQELLVRRELQSRIPEFAARLRREANVEVHNPGVGSNPAPH
jgi:hypothetical protein